MTDSGLFQVMLEGALLLLSLDPAQYPHSSTDLLQPYDCLFTANTAAQSLVMDVGDR
jgi:hypothetical protein